MKDIDFKKFKSYHKNKYNIIIHIISFIIGLTSFLYLFKNNFLRYFLMIIYFNIINIKFGNLILFKTFLILLLSFSFFNYNKINSNKKLYFIIILSYVIPELSHIYFNEKTYLYERLDKEQSLINKIVHLLVHSIYLIPYCFLALKS